MGKALIIGAGGVASVVVHKCCQNSEVFEEICIASRTKSKCDALKEKLDGGKTKITTAQVDADKVEELVALINDFKPDIVHMNNINFQLTPSIIYAIKKRNIPLVQTVHDYQMICPNHLLYDFGDSKPCERCIKGSKSNCFKHIFSVSEKGDFVK